MKRQYCYIVPALLISLFIYLFYRTEKTVINELFVAMVSIDHYRAMRTHINSLIALDPHVIYSLPEALWVFCITLTSKHLFIKLGERQFNLIYAPPIFSIGLELFQLLHLTNGRFDLWDIGLSIMFWAIAKYAIRDDRARQSILPATNAKSLVCMLSYLIVYLAHVWK